MPEPDGVRFIEKPVELTKQRYRVTPAKTSYKRHKNPAVSPRKTRISSALFRQQQQQQNKQIDKLQDNYYHPLTTIAYLEPRNMDASSLEEARAEKAEFLDIISKKNKQKSKNDKSIGTKNNFRRF